jgi:hypothetical protein
MMKELHNTVAGLVSMYGKMLDGQDQLIGLMQTKLEEKDKEIAALKAMLTAAKPAKKSSAVKLVKPLAGAQDQTNGAS